MTKEEIYPKINHKTALLKVLVEVRHDIMGLEEDLERANAVRQYCEAELLRLEREEADSYVESIMEEDLPTGAGKVMQEIDYRGEPTGPATDTFANPPGIKELLDVQGKVRMDYGDSRGKGFVSVTPKIAI